MRFSLVIILNLFFGIVWGQNGVDFCNLSSGSNFCKEIGYYISKYQKEYHNDSAKEYSKDYPNFIKGLKALKEHLEKGVLINDELRKTKFYVNNLRKVKIYKPKKLNSLLGSIVNIVDKNLKEKLCDPNDGSGVIDCDGDGVPNREDCAPKDPKIKGVGWECNDGDPNTENDVFNENCECKGILIIKKQGSIKGKSTKKKENKNVSYPDEKSSELKTKPAFKQNAGWDLRSLIWLLLLPIMFLSFLFVKERKKSSNLLEILNSSSAQKSEHGTNPHLVKKLERDLEDYKREDDKLNAQIKSLKDDLDYKNKQITELKEENESLIKKVTDYQNHPKLIEKNKELNKLKKIIEEKERQLMQKNLELNDLQKELKSIIDKLSK